MTPQIRHQLVLLGGFHLFCNQRGLAVHAGKFDQRARQLGLEGLHVELDKARQRQPRHIAALEHMLIERQPETPGAQGVQCGHPGFNFLGRGAVGEWGHFEHHLVGVDEFQVPAGEAFMRAVDEYGLLAHQCFGAGIRQGIEQQCGITGSGM